MRVFLCFLLSLICFANVAIANQPATSQVNALQQFRNGAKLYAPNFVLIGNQAVFKVVARPNSKVKLVLDYGSTIPKQFLEAETNNKGVAVFAAKIIDDKNLVGKSVAVDAFVLETYKASQYQKAVLQNEQGNPSESNRIYIADKDSAKGVMIAPWRGINDFVMSVDYSENSDFNPMIDLKYDNTTPVYIRNMRDAQENVKEVPTNLSYPN